jgi:hypothetical protein
MSRAVDMYGKGLEALFPGGNPQGVSPFPMEGSTRTYRALNHEAIHQAIQQPDQHMRDFDPRALHGMQGGLVRHIVQHYMTGDNRHGEPYADAHQAGNAHPVVFHNLRTGNMIIASGHHRAAAALLQGQSHQALYVPAMPHTHEEARTYSAYMDAHHRAIRAAAPSREFAAASR